jgi:microcystin-dependent protein
MRNIRFALAFAAALIAALIAAPAFAQNPGIIPQGTFAAGDCYKVAANGNKYQAVAVSGGCSVVAPSALTRINDTNVTVTLGGTPATALLQPTSLTLGWTGTLAASRGGFAADVSAQNGFAFNTAGVFTWIAATGSNNVVRATSPVLVTPNLGTPSAIDLANATNLVNAGVSASAAIALSKLAPLAANTVVGALTATNPSALALPSCSAANNALIWTSGAGFGCNTLASGGTVTTITAGDGITLSSGATCTVTCTITNAGFSTGDMKPTYKTTADTGWVMMNDGTIGSGASGATTRANADTVTLYTLLWNNCSSPTANASCTVATGLGANAAADFAANKALALPKVLGRMVASAGAGSGLTSRTLGTVTGAETVTIAAANLPAHTHVTNSAAATFGVSTGGGAQITITGGTNALTNLNTLNTDSCASCTGTAMAVMPPSQFANFMIKL